VTDRTRVALALGAGLAGGAAIAASGNASLLAAADGLTPIGTIWVNAIRMTVIPLVVSLIVTGIAGASDLSAIGRLGTRTAVVFVAMLAGAAGVVAWLVSIVPTNPIAAAASGNMVSLVVFTVLLAVAIGQTPAASRDVLVSVFRGLADAMLVLVRWVVTLAPIGIFGLILPLAAHGGAGVAGAVGTYVVIYSALSILAVLVTYPMVALFGGVSIATFARAALPAQLIVLSSSSSIASLPALVEAAATLNLPARVTGFVLPLAVSTFKFAGPVSWTTGALFIGSFYGIPIGATQLVTIALASIFLAFAAPGVPRGAFLMLTPLFLTLGLPPEGIGILIAVDALPDLFATVLNVTGDLAAAVIIARADARA